MPKFHLGIMGICHYGNLVICFSLSKNHLLGQSTMKTYTTDASGRLCLGKEFANKMFTLNVKQGNIELMPVQIIPEKEAWLYKNQDALAAVKLGLEQARQGKGKPLTFNLEEDDAWLEETEEKAKGRKR